MAIVRAIHPLERLDRFLKCVLKPLSIIDATLIVHTYVYANVVHFFYYITRFRCTTHSVIFEPYGAAMALINTRMIFHMSILRVWYENLILTTVLVNS